jgi:hypothetical protein
MRTRSSIADAQPGGAQRRRRSLGEGACLCPLPDLPAAPAHLPFGTSWCIRDASEGTLFRAELERDVSVYIEYGHGDAATRLVTGHPVVCVYAPQVGAFF